MSFDNILRKLSNENSKSVADEAIRLLTKVADNILKDPSNLKLRTLQKSNATVSKKILNVTGALECLKLMGFQEQKLNYVLPGNLSLAKVEEFKRSILKLEKIKENISNSTNVSDSSDEKSAQSSESDTIIKKVDLPPLVLTYSNPFLQRIETLYHHVLQYEDKELQRRALKLVPLATLEENAQRRLRYIQEHIKKNKLDDPEISIQETLLLEVLRWFKEDFFSWVDSPECTYCGGKTDFSHMSSDSSLLVYTDRVELHRCTLCHKFTPFPRYNDLNILLETRSGRCGEWANTFTLFCRAMGWDSRYVVDEGDHVWTEVYSVAQKRWLHCDPCENACDTPLMYETGWNKKISYVIGYSADEVQDVTWRYSAYHKEVRKRRDKCSEDELKNALFELRDRRQKNFSEARKSYLTKRMLAELVEFLTEKKPNEDDQRGRSSGSASWRLARGEVQDIIEDSYVWKINDGDIVQDNVTIRYSASMDKYEYISGGNVVKEVKGWSKGIFSSSNIFRKKESDWKMVYLSRKEGEQFGNISWKVDFTNCSKSVATVSLDVKYETYETGAVGIEMSSDDKVKFVENGVTTTNDFCGCRTLTISASFSGGKGNVAWQHAQLFRQSDDSDDFPFVLRITFK